MKNILKNIVNLNFLTTLLFMFTIFFIGVMTLFSSAWPLASNAVWIMRENISTDVPIFDSVKTVFVKTESLYSRYIYGLEFFSRIEIYTNYYITGEIHSTQVLAGKENWLFYKSTTDGGDSLADYQGTAYFSQTLMERVTANLLDIQTTLSQKGIDFAVMICPNKEQIYFDKMPESLTKYDDINRTDVLVDFLRTNSDIPLIYPKAELRSLRNDFQLYFKYDTHWNQLGSYIAQQQFMDLLFQKRNSLRDQEVITLRTNVSGDLATMIGLSQAYHDDEDYGLMIGAMTPPIQDGEYFNDKAQIDQTILLVGDSFRNALVPHFLNEFKHIYVVQISDYNKTLLDTLKPDIVLLEMVERYSKDLAYFDINQ